MRTLILALATTVCFTSAAAAAMPSAFGTQASPVKSSIIRISDGAQCGWYAISVCSTKRSGAVRGADRYGGYVVDTDDFDEFRDGYFCAVKGPSSKQTANKRKKQMRRRGARSAYRKWACE